MSSPAQAIIAEDALDETEIDKIIGDEEDDEDWHFQPDRLTLPTKIKSVDKLFDGGFEYGAIHCLVPSVEQDTRELVYALMLSQLSLSPDHTATLIESNPSFEVRELYRLLENRMADEDDPKNSALQALSKLSITKVFDDHGLKDALEEVRERASHTSEGSMDGPAAIGVKVPRSTIPDSEDEDEEEDLLHDRPASAEDVSSGKQSSEQRNLPRGLLVIDNMSQLFSPRLKEDFATGSASLDSFMQALRHVTATFKLCTVVISHPSKWTVKEEVSISQFRHCLMQPELDVEFTGYVDVLMYVLGIPEKKATSEEKQTGAPRPMVSIIEVVQDRRAVRRGFTAGFIRGPDRSARDAA